MFNCGLILAQLLKKFAQEMKTLKPQLGKKLDEIDHQQAEKPKNSGNDSRIISQTQVQRGDEGKVYQCCLQFQYFLLLHNSNPFKNAPFGIQVLFAN